MTTECRILTKLVDVTAKADSTVTVTHNAPIADIERITSDNQDLPNYMTCEWNLSLLDGSMQHMPDNLEKVGFALFTDSSTDTNCTLDHSSIIDVTFTKNHSSAGITLVFNGSPAPANIRWYDNKGDLLETNTFYPDSSEFFCEKKVENYTRVEIIFSQSAFPYQYIKLMDVLYGANIRWNGENVIDAILTEELNTVSAELSINVCDFTIFNDTKDFSLLNPNGLYTMLQPMQKIIVKERLNDNLIDMGTFYLDTWESDSETKIKFKTIDALGVIDKSTFYKGRIYDREKAKIIVEDIMSSAGWTNYILADDLQDSILSGYIPICTHREALQQVAFALRAVVDCSRSSQIRIYRQPRASIYKINKSRIFMGSKVKLNTFISGIEITVHDYILKTEETKIFDGVLYTGLNEVLFNRASVITTISNGEIIESGVNYAKINMHTTDNCIIMGREYEDLSSTYIRKLDNLPAGETQNIIQIKNASLVSKQNVYLLAEYLFEYYSLRKQADIRYITEYERVGQWVDVQSQYNQYVSGVIERQVIDLAGGFTTQATIMGYNVIESDFCFAGKEIFTGERIGVI